MANLCIVLCPFGASNMTIHKVAGGGLWHEDWHAVMAAWCGRVFNVALESVNVVQNLPMWCSAQAERQTMAHKKMIHTNPS